MGTVDEYLAGLGEQDRASIAHVYDIARETAGQTTQGTSYGMSALLYRGRR